MSNIRVSCFSACGCDDVGSIRRLVKTLHFLVSKMYSIHGQVPPFKLQLSPFYSSLVILWPSSLPGGKNSELSRSRLKQAITDALPSHAINDCNALFLRISLPSNQTRAQSKLIFTRYNAKFWLELIVK